LGQPLENQHTLNQLTCTSLKILCWQYVTIRNAMKEPVLALYSSSLTVMEPVLAPRCPGSFTISISMMEPILASPCSSLNDRTCTSSVFKFTCCQYLSYGACTSSKVPKLIHYQ
jgi:hypothetical protein